MKPLWLHFHMLPFVFQHFKKWNLNFFCPILTSAAALEGERVKCILFHLSTVGLVSASVLYWDLFTHRYTSVFFPSLLGYFDVVKIKFRPWWTESLQWLNGESTGTRTRRVVNLILTWGSEFFWAFRFRILFLPNVILMKLDKWARSSLRLFQRDLGVPIAQLSKKKRGNKLRKGKQNGILQRFEKVIYLAWKAV